MKPRGTLKRKLVVIGSALLCVALLSIGLTLWITRQLEGGAAAVNEAGRMRMQTWRLASSVQAEASQANLEDLVAAFDDSIRLLRDGDPSRPLFVPWNEAEEAQFAVVVALWSEQRKLWLSPTPLTREQALHAAEEYAGAIDKLVQLIEMQLARLTAVLNLFQFGMLALAVLGAVVMMYTGYLYVIHPLGRLGEGLARVQSGELDARVEVDTQDEFGQVAEGFNRMAQTLASLYDGLEAQVLSKTQHIEAQRARLAVLYEVSAFLGQAGSIEEMSRGFAQRVREFMKADALAVRWSDEASQRYLMLASDCLPREIAEEERSLLAGACACGGPMTDARIRVIPIISHEQAAARHCARYGYETVVSVPVRLQQRVLGEFDLFYRTPTSLTREEKALLDALSSHLASSLEGLRAAALEREAAVGEERSLLARELHDSIAQSLAFMKIQVQMMRAAARSGRMDQLEQVIEEMDTGVRESINDVRELLVHFRTRTNLDDIEPALQLTLRKFEHQTGLATRLLVEGDGVPLLSDVQVQVLHVVQEALSNVRKHAAQVSEVTVRVVKGDGWRFEVQDNGAGFELQRQRGENHVGLNIMRERAQRIGATLDIESAPGRGTCVTLRLPPLAAVMQNGEPATLQTI